LYRKLRMSDVCNDFTELVAPADLEQSYGSRVQTEAVITAPD